MAVRLLPASEMAMPLILDDRSSGTLAATNGTSWRAITDTVMGGVSSGT